IDPVPLPRRLSADLARVPTRLRHAVAQAGAVIDRMGADVVVGFGGYVALPAYLAARRRRVPLVIHEANARAGLANRVGARFAAAIAVATPVPSFPSAARIGMPLRRSVSTLDRTAARPVARAQWGFDHDRPVLFVFGGSQGARRLNDAVTGAAAALIASGVQVLHATGINNHDDVSAQLRDAGVSDGYVAVPYVDDMPAAYAAADLAVCRSGAMTVAEVTAVGLPAVFVPLPIGNGEQRLNAQPVVSAGGGEIVPDEQMTPAVLAEKALPLLTDSNRLAEMAVAAAGFGRRDADDALASIVRDAAGGKR
ncbi:MAG TPA: UDP-N-acetylglucosamine--N-acetylmuramyl-(pentapeptide) pyrophosphoryl-undecaprenol N-acetylglucosamine transferase, partial [Mycobacteriales bacterium]|nr:UDP-N-acetylglucosamine--N-acetylmuramyl-(pentapeptide) pyrophosphoryl-undecaprenol N-acetylglucosamine transferase [Mycobacteriales bacterium]